MSLLPDPRNYPALSGNGALAGFVQRNEEQARCALLRWIRERLESAGDEEILEALHRMSPARSRAYLWDLVCRAVDEEAAGDRRIVARLFAFPMVFVAAAPDSSILPGTVPDMEAIRALLEKHGALGAVRNFGLGNALVASATLERLKPSVVYRWARDWAGPPRDLPPEDIRVERGREQVHLRFIVGAAITPREAPSFIETASNISAWGAPLTRTLTRQLAQPQVELLAMPRPPVSLLRAPLAGRWAEIETAFHVFASNTLREFRSSVGDPTVMVSAHEGPSGSGEVRVSMSCALDDTLLEGFRWPLHPFEDLDRVEMAIAELLRECRVNDVRFIPKLLPGRLPSGRLYLRGGDMEKPEASH